MRSASASSVARSARAPARVLHILPGLDGGGTETMLFRVLAASGWLRTRSSVVSLGGRGRIGEQIAALGVPVLALGVGGWRAGPVAAARLAATARRIRPAVIQGWLAHGNLAALVAAAAVGFDVRAFWNVRHTLDGLGRRGEFKPATAFVVRGLARMSRWPAAIFYNSCRAMQQHERLGYCRDRSILLPNGFDTDAFRPSEDAHRSVCDEIGVSRSALLVGMLARFHPMKGHADFLNAAKRVAAENPRANFVLAGIGVNPGNDVLTALLRDLGLTERVHLLGERADTSRIMAALDVLVSASCSSEAFSNSVGEAMACGTPCIVTDVGDSAQVVGNSGLVIPPRDPDALAAALTQLLSAEPEFRQRLGSAARARIVADFSIRRIAARYEEIYARAITRDEMAAPPRG